MTNSVARDVGQAADAIRTANHSTMRGALDGPESYDVVESLVELVQRLPQVLDFVARSLHRVDPASHFAEAELDVAWLLDLAGAHVSDARHQADAMREQLDHAHDYLGHIGRQITED